MEAENGALFTGLPGLDYALGEIAPGEMVCISGPTCAGKTLLLLDLAARISSRYRQNVLFYSAHKPTVYLAKKAALKGGTDVRIWEDGDTRRGGPAVYLLDSSTENTESAIAIAVRLEAEGAIPGAVLIMDGWSSYAQQTNQIEVIDGTLAYPAERWPHSLLSRERMGRLRELTHLTRLRVVLGVTTASLMDDEALANSLHHESEIRRNADHWVKLYRPELYKVTAEIRPEARNVVELTGTSLTWWDTRCSKLRLDPRDLSFATVV
ncbi:MAG: hypothetical protein ACLPV8_08790 [Steroidobacteraceae bacterium]